MYTYYLLLKDVSHLISTPTLDSVPPSTHSRLLIHSPTFSECPFWLWIQWSLSWLCTSECPQLSCNPSVFSRMKCKFDHWVRYPQSFLNYCHWCSTPGNLCSCWIIYQRQNCLELNCSMDFQLSWIRKKPVLQIPFVSFLAFPHP